MNKEQYLKVLTEQIRCKQARNPIKNEIENHIEDQIEAFKMEGMNEGEAQEAALREMGDPVEVGNSLDRIHRTKMPWKEIFVIGILGICGIGLQYFLQQSFQVQDYSIGGNLTKQVFFLIVSLVFMIGICLFDYSWIGYYAKEIMVMMSVVIILGQKLFGTMVNGASRWIYFGGISFSIPMLLLLFIPLYGAILYSYRGQNYKAIIKSILWMLPGVMIGFMCSSSYTVIVLVFSFNVLLTIAVCRRWYHVSSKMTLVIQWGIMLLIPITLLAGTLLNGKSYRIQRLAWIFNLSGALERNYFLDIIRSIVSGSSLSEFDTSVYGILLGDHLLACVLSYFGIFAVVVIISVLAVLFTHFYSITFRQKNQMGMLMGTGCSFIFILELVLYVLDNLGIVYIGSCYCPFLTYGGSGMMVTFILFGMILSITRYENVYPEQGKRKLSVKVTIE